MDQREYLYHGDHTCNASINDCLVVVILNLDTVRPSARNQQFAVGRIHLGRQQERRRIDCRNALGILKLCPLHINASLIHMRFFLNQPLSYSSNSDILMCDGTGCNWPNSWNWHVNGKLAVSSASSTPCQSQYFSRFSSSIRLSICSSITLLAATSVSLVGSMCKRSSRGMAKLGLLSVINLVVALQTKLTLPGQPSYTATHC